MISRKKFLSALAVIFTTPTTLFAQGLKACQSKIEMFGDLCKPKPSKPITAKPPAQRTVHRYSATYNIEGDFNASDRKISQHLIQVHGINTAGMSRDQMLMAHDRAHGVRFSSAPPQASSCPGGVCPTGKRGRR